LVLVANLLLVQVGKMAIMVQHLHLVVVALLYFQAVVVKAVFMLPQQLVVHLLARQELVAVQEVLAVLDTIQQAVVAQQDIREMVVLAQQV
jgi:hypothetical protein